MAASRKHILFLPTLSEYAYRILVRLTEDQKKSLSPAEQVMLKSENTINQFCKSETLDRILLILTKLGVDWAIMTYPDEEIAQQLTFNVFNQYQFIQKRSDVVNVMKRENIYAVSSREAMVNVQMMAQNAHTDVYHLSEHMKDLIKRNRAFASIPGYDETVASATQSFDDFARIILEVFNSVDHRSSTWDLDELETRIMLTLFEKRNSVSNLLTVQNGVKLGSKKNYLKKRLEGLQQRGLIVSEQKHLKNTNRVQNYLITTKGIKVIMEYVKYIYDRCDFKK